MATVTVLIVLLLLAVAAIGIARTAPRREVRERPHGSVRDTGLPPGRVVYSDDGEATRPLVAQTYPLIGKPDYVVLSPAGHRIPVEIKSACVAGAPRHEDVLQ